MSRPTDRADRADRADHQPRILPVNELPERHTGGAPANEAESVGVDLEIPSSVLAVGAHPDDIEFGCGGTLAKWAAEGSEIWHLVLTDGSRGSWDPNQRRGDLVTQRQEEAREAARRLGSRDVSFGPWVDGELEDGSRQRWVLSAALRRIRPTVVLGHDPWRRYRLHPDHRAAGQILVSSVVAARDPHFFPDQDLAPHRPSVMLLWEADTVNHVENVEGRENTKVDALLAHRSQYETTMGIAPTGAALRAGHSAAAPLHQRVEAQLWAHGSVAGLASGEAFHRVDKL